MRAIHLWEGRKKKTVTKERGLFVPTQVVTNLILVIQDCDFIKEMRTSIKFLTTDANFAT
jgi:hypothetical protein